MIKLHNHKFPGESAEYRQARNELLEAEIKLRRELEAVAVLRRQLPLGGKLKEDYVFAGSSASGGTEPVKFSDLFTRGKPSLVVYNFMYAPEAKTPCPLCTSFLDGLNGEAVHIQEKINLVVVAKAPIEKLRAWARERGWTNLRLLSSFNNAYNQDYFGEVNGYQMPNLNVFQKTAKGIYHFYSTELLYTPTEKVQGTRHVDLLWPLWVVLDLTPEGRGQDWNPKLSYKKDGK